jgi:uncharacterized protein (TIGR02646 family)
MIPIRRGEEPEALRTSRRWRLARARFAHHAGVAQSFEGYNVSAVLWERQHHKCAYCEAPLRSPSNQPTEHFRPKARYWWLAWSWENLLLACSTCNDAAHKGDRFPLEPGSPALAPLDMDVSQERALLLDPARDDPQQHIEYQLVGARWMPVARDGSQRGDETIRILGLDEVPGILDQCRDHVRHVLMPAIERVEEGLRMADEARGDAEQEQALFTVNQHRWWPLVQRHVVNQRAQHRALSWHVLDHHFPRSRRRAYRLSPLPSLATGWEPGPTPQVDGPIDALGVDGEAYWLVRAVGPSQSEGYAAWMARALVAVCAEAPRDLAALCAIFELGEDAMRGHLGRVVAAKALGEDAGYWRVV